MRNLYIIFSLLTFQASAHVLNYKNVNTIASLICQHVKTSATNQVIEGLKNSGDFVSKFKQDKSVFSKNEFKIELTGTCNAQVKIENSATNIVSYGQEIHIQFDSKKGLAQGTVGLDEIKVEFNPHDIKGITVTDTLINKKRSIKISSAQWSPNNMIFTQKPIQLKLKNGLKIREVNSTLALGKVHKVYNLWNYESFSCGFDVSQDQCSKLTQNI